LISSQSPGFKTQEHFSITSIGEERHYNEGNGMRVRLNLLCLVGAGIGIASLFATWVGTYYRIMSIPGSLIVNYPISYNVLDVVGLGPGEHSWHEFWLPCLIYLIGTLAALATPLAGVVQAFGVSTFFLALRDQYGDFEPRTIGPCLAVVSVIVVLASLIRPVGWGYRAGQVDLVRRLLSIGLIREKEV
jgi:hypothetical protein